MKFEGITIDPLEECKREEGTNFTIDDMWACSEACDRKYEGLLKYHYKDVNKTYLKTVMNQLEQMAKLEKKC